MRPLVGAALVAVASLACTEARPLDPATDGTGGAEGSTTAPAPFVPYAPPAGSASGGLAAAPGGSMAPSGAGGSAGGGTGGGGDEAGTAGGPGTAGRATAGSGGASTLGTTRLGLLPIAVSGDGSVVIGGGETEPGSFRWTATTGAQPLAAFDVGDVASALALSEDGMTIVGAAIPPVQNELTVTQAVRWIGLAPVSLGALADALPSDSTMATLVSHDGQVIAGTSTARSGTTAATQPRAFRWTPAGGMVALGALPGDVGSEPLAMSADGKTIVGLSFDESGPRRAFTWTVGAGMTELPAKAGMFAVPRAVDGSGTRVVGDWLVLDDAPTNLAHFNSETGILWNDGGPRPLSCPTEKFSRTVAISSTTSTILGACVSQINGAATLETPFITRGDGDFEMLAAPSGLDEVSPVGISDDARTVVANARGPGLAPSIVVWSSQQTPVAPEMMTMGGAFAPAPIDLQVTALSGDGSTVVGSMQLADDPQPHGFLSRLR